MNTEKLTKRQKKGLAFRDRKKNKVDNEPEDRAVPTADVAVDNGKALDPRTAKERVTVGKKRKRDANEDKGAPPGDGAFGAEDGWRREGKKRKLSKDTEQEKEKTALSRTRFILFVGNLKYTTSLKAIREHFSSCDPPPQVRLLTPKSKSPAPATAKSKGCAFLEFSHRNALQQGLKFHGSNLDGRRINVELTAGGGGKSEKRLEKVKARNKQLIEERKTRIQKKAESATEIDNFLTAPPQRHSTTSGMEDVPQKRRTWTVPQNGEESGRGGVKQRGKKGKLGMRSWGTGANSISVG